jgi:hypothetical protein
MKKVFAIFLTGVLSVSQSVLHAQDNSNCVALLQHGIFDTFRQSNGTVNSAQYKYDLCTAYSKLQHDQLSGSAMGFYDLAGGEGKFSSDQLTQIGSSMCTASSSSTYSQSDLNTFSQVIDPSAAAAYTECVKLNSSGLRANTVIRESDAGQMTLDTYYVAPVGSLPTVAVQNVVISPASSFTCTGPLVTMAGSATQQMDTHSFGMSCARQILATPPPGTNVLAPAATIVVITNVGSITRSFAPVLASPPPPPFHVPVGTIVAFNGSATDAAAQTANGWWICDGRQVTDILSTAFKGKNTPDLRTKFLSGDSQSGNTGGAPSFLISDQTITSHTTGGFGAPNVTSDPATHMRGANSWTTDNSIYSAGTWTGITVPTLPPFYGVVYLIRVR